MLKETDTGIHKTFERGPVAVLLDVDKKEITLADRLNFKISVTADEAYEFELPKFGDKLEQFGIVDYQTTQPQLVENNRTQVARSYVLEPFLSGDYKIPPMKIIFWEKGKKETEPHEIETEELTIKVTSLLPEAKEDLKLHDIKPPVGLPRSPYFWIWIGGGVAVTLMLIIGFLLVRTYLRKKEEDENGRISAHDQAYMELEALVAKDLLGKGEIKLFYQKISNILRRYIENRFGLQAPEQTTEEFLAGIDAGDRLPEKYNPLLRTFLVHCDLVKFAEYKPTQDDIQKTFDSCKAFIAETREPREIGIDEN
ncbi:MAG: hypothetical protein GY864_06260 [Desulfobacterales bacterium]|nr:hypothetical protein [Desulfobacterales bacterium]